MRILHVIQELGFGGAERVVASLVAGSKAAGHDVAVAAAPGPLADDLGCPSFRLPFLERRPERLPLVAWSLRRAVRSWRPTIVHCHNPGMALVGSLVTSRGHRPPGLVSVHGVPDADYAAAARLLRWSGLPAVACGPGVAAALRDYGFNPKATIVNGVSPPPPSARREAVIQRFGIAHTRFLVVGIGRLVPQKNQLLAIQALTNVPDAALIIFGEGPLRENLDDAASALGVQDRLILAGNDSEVRALMGAADAVVISSNWEGMPLVALEALAAGTPLVTTAVRGITELLHHDVDCLMVPAGDAHGLAQGLCRVLEDRALARRLVERGSEVAAAFSEASMVRRFLEFYELLARGRPR